MDPDRARNQENSNTYEKYVQTAERNVFNGFHRRAAEKSSERRTISVAQVTFMKRIGENSGKNRKENVVSAHMKHRNKA